MFDILPVNERGDFDDSKIGYAGKKKPADDNRAREWEQLLFKNNAADQQIENYGPEVVFDFSEVKVDDEPIKVRCMAEVLPASVKMTTVNHPEMELPLAENYYGFTYEVKEPLEPAVFAVPRPKKKTGIILRHFAWPEAVKSNLVFVGLAAAVLIFISLNIFVGRGLRLKDAALNKGMSAIASLAQAKDLATQLDFAGSEAKFSQAAQQFQELSQEFSQFSGVAIAAARYLPFVSKLSSGDNLAKAGENFSRVGELSSQIFQILVDVKNSGKNRENVSYLSIFNEINSRSGEILDNLKSARENLDAINVADLPDDQRTKLIEYKKMLPDAIGFVSAFADNSHILADILGNNGPRKYLFLFQNSQEMRPTGGFIGSYGVLDIFNGRVKNFFIDGIFNPDGQLAEKIIPPAPIQKISAAWSLHDSNWFPDFPVSAEKAISFYEKTGGPTVDGVITFTPDILGKFLEITGPIEMPQYGTTVDSDNFISQIQEEVEINYDREENQPKKILSDLAPIVLDKIFNSGNLSDLSRSMTIIAQSLEEKQILIYARNYDTQKKISDLDWSGEILKTQKDYLSVINANINGYKTDGVIDESIDFESEIQPDGSIIDAVSITRKHNGGDTAYNWWNKVNPDYMRVYVPEGSTLLSAEGQTREFNTPPLDYQALNFHSDPQVRLEEENTEIDKGSGTYISKDAGKTVFGNWVYVSPQESVTITYKYRLPFKADLSGGLGKPATYSLLAQKQSGSAGSKLSARIKLPDGAKTIWNYPESVQKDKNVLSLETVLATDKYFGLAFQ